MFFVILKVSLIFLKSLHICFYPDLFKNDNSSTWKKEKKENTNYIYTSMKQGIYFPYFTIIYNFNYLYDSNAARVVIICI